MLTNPASCPSEWRSSRCDKGSNAQGQSIWKGNPRSSQSSRLCRIHTQEPSTRHLCTYRQGLEQRTHQAIGRAKRQRDYTRHWNCTGKSNIYVRVVSTRSLYLSGLRRPPSRTSHFTITFAMANVVLSEFCCIFVTDTNITTLHHRSPPSIFLVSHDTTRTNETACFCSTLL
jgi:hypothetical protein